MNGFSEYVQKLSSCLATVEIEHLRTLELSLIEIWNRKGTLFLCGNGGSAGNASHLANDFTFGAGHPKRYGLSVDSLSSNPAVLTCLANDIGYENIYSYQLSCKAKKGDVVMIFSGSGNSPNIINALIESKKLGCISFAVLGFDGGQARNLADVAIHINCNDMQICEDIQLIIGHYLVQCLSRMANGGAN